MFKKIILVFLLVTTSLSASATAKKGLQAYKAGNYLLAYNVWKHNLVNEVEPGQSSFYLSNMYLNGIWPAPQNNYSAMKMLRIGATYGFKPAMIKLAQYMEEGKITDKNLYKAFTLYKFAQKDEEATKIWNTLSKKEKFMAAQVMKRFKLGVN